MKRTHKQFIECLKLLNEYNSIVETSEESSISKQTLYNMFYKDKSRNMWVFKPKYLAKWYEVYSAYKMLLILLQNNTDFACNQISWKYLLELEAKIEEFNALEISVS